MAENEGPSDVEYAFNDLATTVFGVGTIWYARLPRSKSKEEIGRARGE